MNKRITINTALHYVSYTKSRTYDLPSIPSTSTKIKKEKLTEN